MTGNITGSYDFIAVGGGPSGVAAAVSAARRGLRTALVEKSGCLGGMATAGGVHHLLGGLLYDESSRRYRYNVGGLFREISDTLIQRGKAVDPHTIDRSRNPMGWFPSLAAGIAFDPEEMKCLLDTLCLEAGVDVYLLTQAVDAILEKNHIRGLTAVNKSGLFGMEAPFYGDFTGDGDLAFWTGCSMVLGDKDGGMAPASLGMCVEHVDGEAMLSYIENNNEPRFRSLIASLRRQGIWRFPFDVFICIRLDKADVYMINTLRQVGIDGTCGDSLTRGMMEGRRDNMELFHIMKDHFPGFSDARIRSISQDPGIRETRRIQGEYVLRVEDVTSGEEVPDCVALSSYGWDLPDPKRPSHQPMEGRGGEIKGGLVRIPYRALVPRPVENLVMAGRCISVERDVLGPVRVMGPCMGTGQAAGLATLLAFRHDIPYREVDAGELAYELDLDGCIRFMGKEG
ncbi:MAG: FAD-dependent oxidoreductase [Clostridia bacterium]